MYMESEDVTRRVRRVWRVSMNDGSQGYIRHLEHDDFSPHRGLCDTHVMARSHNDTMHIAQLILGTDQTREYL